ncbi:MAG: antibiotic biosynthesis monooxygenase [Cryobacterium sp.]
MALTVLLDLRLKAEAVATAPAMLREILTDTRVFDGCLSVDVLVDTADPTHLILLERWASTEADAAYRAWRAGAGASELGSLLVSAPQVSQFETADDI